LVQLFKSDPAALKIKTPTKRVEFEAVFSKIPRQPKEWNLKLFFKKVHALV